VGAVVPRGDVRVELVCLVDGGDGEGVVPQAERLARGKGQGARGKGRKERSVPRGDWTGMTSTTTDMPE
jgi:hypothetical protein